MHRLGLLPLEDRGHIRRNDVSRGSHQTKEVKITETEEGDCYWCSTPIKGTGDTKVEAYNNMVGNIDSHEAICIQRYRAEKGRK